MPSSVKMKCILLWDCKNYESLLVFLGIPLVGILLLYLVQIITWNVFQEIKGTIKSHPPTLKNWLYVPMRLVLAKEFWCHHPRALVGTDSPRE